MKNRYISNIIGIFLLLAISLMWIVYCPAYYNMGTRGIALLATIVYQIFSYSIVATIYAIIFIIEFLIYKIKLLKPLELNINKKITTASLLILVSPIFVIFLTFAVAIIGEKALTRQYTETKYEHSVPVERNLYYEEQSNSGNNDKYSSRSVSVRVTPNGIERSERLTPNRNYHK